MTVVASKLPSEAISVQQKCHVQYTLPLPLCSPEKPDAITLFESRALISAAGTTGLRTWDAALHLGSYLVSPDGRELVAGKTVLELGAGTGFLSILCTKYLGARYTGATDGDGRVAEDLSANFLLNGLDTSPLADARVLKWGGDSGELFSKFPDPPQMWQTVLAADVVSWMKNYSLIEESNGPRFVSQIYDVDAVPSLLLTIKNLIDHCPGVRIIIAAAIRNRDTFDAFLASCCML